MSAGDAILFFSLSLSATIIGRWTYDYVSTWYAHRRAVDAVASVVGLRRRRWESNRALSHRIGDEWVAANMNGQAPGKDEVN